jgi:hypothetical protein
VGTGAAGEPLVDGLHLTRVRRKLPVTEKQEAGRRERAVETPAAITDQPGRPKTIESLKCLLERLGSADLTLSEAKRLRSQVHMMLSGCDPESEG